MKQKLINFLQCFLLGWFTATIAIKIGDILGVLLNG